MGVDQRLVEMRRYYDTINSRTHEMILSNVRRISGRRYKRLPNWSLAMEVFGIGSTYARILCSEAGIDPDATA